MNDADFIKRMAVLAQLCRFDLSAQVLEAYDRLLSVHGYEKLCQALDHFLRTRSARDPFPSVADVDAIVYGKSNETDLAALASASIYSAVAAFGWPNAEAARGRLGDDVWSVVKAAGGWAQVCEDANETDPGVFKAQLREIARAVIHRTAAGKAGEVLEFPKPHAQVESKGDLKALSNFIPKKIQHAGEVDS